MLRIFYIVGALVFALGCTRPPESTSFKLSFGGGSQGSLALNGYLEFVAVNIRIPGAPIVRTFDFEENPIPSGQSFTLEVPNVPAGSFLVQVLGVYQDGVNPRKIAYGDATAIVSGGQSTVNIVINEAGSFAVEGRISGRYLDTVSTPELGPTGVLVMQYQPPGGKPKMDIEKFPIVDGWFSVMMFDGVPMDYMLQSTGALILDDLRIQTPTTISLDGQTITTGTELASFRIPGHYKRERKDNMSLLRARPPSQIFVGFIKKPGVVGFNSKAVCYSRADEGHRYLFKDAALSEPLDFSLESSLAGNIVNMGGGTAIDPDVVYMEKSSPCSSMPVEDRLVVNHLSLTDEEKAAGFSLPFKAKNPYQPWGKYLDISYEEPSSVPQIRVEWELLPATPSVEEIAVFAKYSPNGGGGGGLRDGCNSLASKGYVEVTSVPYASNFITFTGTIFTPLTTNNRHNWQFAICAYRTVGTGRQWLGEPAEGSFGHWNDLHFGWAHSEQNFIGTPGVTPTDLGATVYRIENIAIPTNLATVVTTSDPASGLNVNDEVLLYVTGMDGTDSCGISNGNPIHAGSYAFTRVLDVNVYDVSLARGTFVDHMYTATAALQATPAAGSTFCFLQMYRVPHFRTLDLLATTSLTMPSAGFNFGAGVGTILPIRVNALAAFNSLNFSLMGSGYMGGMATPMHGAGLRGPTSVSQTSETGGQGHASGGGGGGGYGQGANGVGGGGGLGRSTNMARTHLYAGGGGGGNGSATAGNGGGTLFFLAREVVINTNVEIYATGTGGSGDAGGGGGGSINFVTRRLAGAGTLSLYADGGSGSGGGGAGGGGFVWMTYCDGTPTVNTSAVAGILGQTTGAMPGGVYTEGATSQTCKNLD